MGGSQALKEQVVNIITLGSKTELLYQVMIYKRQESKDKMLDYLDSHGKLSWDGLYAYAFPGLIFHIFRIFSLIRSESVAVTHERTIIRAKIPMLPYLSRLAT